MTWRIPPIGWCVACAHKGEQTPAEVLLQGTSFCVTHALDELGGESR